MKNSFSNKEKETLEMDPKGEDSLDCMCVYCMANEINEDLAKTEDISTTYGIIRGRFIVALIRTILGAIKNEELEEMLDTIDYAKVMTDIFSDYLCDEYRILSQVSAKGGNNGTVN